LVCESCLVEHADELVLVVPGHLGDGVLEVAGDGADDLVVLRANITQQCFWLYGVVRCYNVHQRTIEQKQEIRLACMRLAVLMCTFIQQQQHLLCCTHNAAATSNPEDGHKQNTLT
jgi:hypothetical protein